VKRLRLLKEKNTRGELMLEALIVYPITMFLLFFVLAIFSVLYQRWNLQTIANESVTRMAQTYRLYEADESTGYVTKEQLVGVGKYRYVGNTFSHNMEEKIEERVNSYAQWRMANTSYTRNVREPVCEVTVSSDGIGRRHLELTISGEYAVPFGEFLDYFGFEGTTTYEVSAYADTVDLMDYINFVDYVDTWTSLKQFKSSIISMIDSFFGLFDNLMDG
jgi:hypothetical protein